MFGARERLFTDFVHSIINNMSCMSGRTMPRRAWLIRPFKYVPMTALTFAMAVPSVVCAEAEAWYTYWSIGISRHSYDSTVQSFIDGAQNAPGAFARTEGSVDAFGFYWPVGDNTILGVVAHSTSDSLSRVDNNGPSSFSEIFAEFPYASGASEYMTISQSLYGVSAMRFLGREPGHGLFVRGDAGVVKLRIDTELDAPIVDDTGYGFLGGIGYGHPLSEETRILFSLTYSRNQVGGHAYGATSLNVGGLW